MYQDHGVVRTWFAEAAEPHELSFSTWFMKPSYFRFEFSVPHPFPPLRHIVTKSVCGFDGIKAYILTQKFEAAAVIDWTESLGTVVAGATGISGGSAHTIARLLLPEINGFSLNDLTDVKFEQEVEVEGILCYEITGVHAGFGSQSIWIGKPDLLLRKLFTRAQKFSIEEVRSGIVVGAVLQPDVFSVPQ